MNVLKKLPAFLTRNERRPRTALATTNEGFVYDGLGTIKIELSLSPERRAEFEGKLKSLMTEKGRADRAAMFEFDHAVGTAQVKKAEALNAARDTYDDARRALFIEYQTPSTLDLKRAKVIDEAPIGGALGGGVSGSTISKPTPRAKPRVVSTTAPAAKPSEQLTSDNPSTPREAAGSLLGSEGGGIPNRIADVVADKTKAGGE